MAAGVFLGRWLVMALLTVVLFVVGWVSARAVAPGVGVDTSAWLDAGSWRAAGEDLLRILAHGTGWAVLGTVIGTLTRSVPVGLGLGVLWAGPVENVLGDDLELAQRWFPGLVLRHVTTGDTTYSAAQLGWTLTGYAAVCLGVLAVVLRRRDVTS